MTYGSTAPIRGAQWFDGAWRTQNGARVYQEQCTLPDGMPVAAQDYGVDYDKPMSDLYISTAHDSRGNEVGYWVMDRLGSVHQLPWRDLVNAERYLCAAAGNK